MMALAGTSIPIPMPVGEGTHFLLIRVSSSTVNRIPSTTAITSAMTAPRGSALRPWERSLANPAHRCEVGTWRPCSPPIP